ncbi:MAG TPA: ATP-binding protein [Blastocatellia bacterium]|nr:ATP-binding protein [Blastocatellia bacterium]
MIDEIALHWMNDLSVQGIFITDAELTIRGWNHWLEARTGRGASEMIGRNLFDAYPELIERGLDKHYKDAIAGQVMVLSHRFHRYLIEMPSQVEDQSFAQMQQSARIAPLTEDNSVIGTITIIDDVTERIAYEQQLVRLLAREQAARKEAETANRAKDEFLATVSHELRTPLNAIAGWVQILRKNVSDAESFAHGIEIIDRNVKMQTKIIEDILDVSRIITGKLKFDVMPVHLVPVIEAALESVRLAAEVKAIRIQTVFNDPDSLVSGDPNRLQQIVWNLVSNAIKFTPKSGTVSVRLDRAGSQVEITVSDTGKGISAEFLPFVFDRFRQADSTSTRHHSGLGLGLAIVRHLVEMHGGTVHATSDGEEQGATFIVRLPLLVSRNVEAFFAGGAAQFSGDNPEPSLAAEGEPNFIDAGKLNGLRVLIVEDQADAREMLQVMLTQFGAEVRVSGSAREALKMLERWLPEILVSDIGMPDEDGYALIQKIRELMPESGGQIPAIALTGYARPEDREQLLSAGYQAHLSKPVELAELVNLIASLGGQAGESCYATPEK